ncbi:helix-turn-helix transcriptional regulator [Streptomyces sp. NPDC006923]|uniref:helix-turn-helix domain-containing protein n=1 Tax=Streptomyces sp. NPDC006923 TaxID=3155355 RepID=UPI00340A9324
MPTSPLSTAQAARKALAERLGEIRKDAQLTGRELGVRCGWSESKSSRIESARTAPSDADIRAWCAACNADAQAADLVAANRTAESMYVQWKRRHRAGMRRAQVDLLPLYERTRAFRIYCSNVVPGILQTPPYASALMTMITTFQGTPNDVAEAVASRMERSRVLYRGQHIFSILLEETVLRYRLGGAEVMAGQLEHLLAVSSLPSVSLGIIPAAAERRMWPLEAFYLFDDRLVNVETLTAEVNVTAPSEAHDYGKAFRELTRSAVFGTSARALITDAVCALR